jgi:hypothetical protein
VLAAAVAQEPVRTTVGIPGRIAGVVLEGGELEAVPASLGSKVVLRIGHVQRHGTAHRYDLEFTGFEAGEYDLAQWLRRKDQTAAELPPIPVVVERVLPPRQVEPSALPAVAVEGLGGYRTLLWAAGGAWLAGLAALLFVRRRRGGAAAAPPKPLTLADRLRPVVGDAVAGRLPKERLAELERLLLAYWRRRLGLEARPAAEAILRLREHEEAGTLLRELERWLHAPPATRAPVDVGALLRPYENLPADAAEESA